MSAIDHTSDPMADRWEALTQAIRAERDAHRKLRAERDAHRERAEHAEARATAAETIRQKADAGVSGCPCLLTPSAIHHLLITEASR